MDERSRIPGSERYSLTVTDQPRLSKSRFLSGSQCRLRLWHDFHAPHLADEAGDVLQAVFDTGHEVGELACRLYPGGHPVGHDHRHMEEAKNETRMVIEKGAASALYEAAFDYEGLFARADVIERLPGGGWRLVEVKSTTRLKGVFVLDLAFQLWVLRGAGLDVRDAGVLTLDRTYVYDGKRLDLDALFQLHGVFEQAEAMRDTVAERARELQTLIRSDVPPDIAPGGHCFAPYACPYYAHCTRDQATPDHGIDELPGLRAWRRDRLKARDIEEIRDIPANFSLSPLQRIARRAVREGRARVHGNIRRAFATVGRPIHHLDFETFAPAIPRFAGTSPYDAIPFLFSVHTERDGMAPSHTDYLHEGKDDPRPKLADRLIEAVGREGTICTYTGYERHVLWGLVNALPERADALGAIVARLFDLHRVVRSTYYHPDFRGSFSLKNVLPVLSPDTGYSDLAIADGQKAAVQYSLALRTADIEQRGRMFDDLRAYCARDTLATVKLRQALARTA